MARSGMPDDISPNTINAQQERRAEPIKQRLIGQGVGRDEAEERAIREAVTEEPGGGRAVGGTSAPEDKDSGHD